MNTKKIFYIILTSILIFNAFQFVLADDEPAGGGGRTMTAEEFEIFRANKPEISDVKLNEKAIEVLQDPNSDGYVDLEQVEVAPLGDEVTASDEVVIRPFSNITAYSLPTSYDVSLNNSFPPIQNQGDTNSCAGWSYGYYQATNNIANVRGYNAKTTANGNDPTKYQMSPMWLYNLVNGGINGYAYDKDVIHTLVNYGCPSWSVVNGQTTPSNYASWNPGANIWEKALENKFADFERIELVDYNNNQEGGFKNGGFERLKTLLLDGYVVSFHTLMEGDNNNATNWHTRTRKNPTTGAAINENVCYYVREVDEKFGHFVTLVGYDDNIWVDVNNNGIADTGELGAFKIANSWGTGFSNNGYIWLSYDALKKNTGIFGVTNQSGRRAAISNYTVFYLKPYKTYTPLLTAEVKLNTARRNQIGIEIGISPTTATTPAVTTKIVKHKFDPAYKLEKTAFDFINHHPNLNHRGGNNFTGGTSAADGVFTFDLTAIAEEYAYYMTNNTAYRFYIKVTDNTADSYSTTLKSFKVVDRRNNATLNSQVALPLTANNSTVTAYTDFTVPIIANQSKMFNFQFSSPMQSNTLTSENIHIKDDNGNIVDGTILYVYPDNKNGMLLAPFDGYEKNRFYTFYINTGVKTLGGNSFSKQQSFDFYIP